MRIRRPLRAPAVLVLTALSLAACSSSGSSHATAALPSTSTSASTPPATAATTVAQWCTALHAAQASAPLDIEYSTDPSEATTAAQIKSEATKTAAALEPLETTAPAAIRREFAAMVDAIRVAARTGSSAGFFTLYASPAGRRFLAFLKNSCDFPIPDPLTTETTEAPSPTTTPGPNHGADNAACRLLKLADVQAFLGAVPTVQPNSGDEDGECWFEAQISKSANLMLDVSLFHDPFFYDGDRSKTARAINGIGDRAYLDIPTSGGPRFGAQKGKIIVQLSLGGGSTDGKTPPWQLTTPSRQDAFIALGKEAVGNL